MTTVRTPVGALAALSLALALRAAPALADPSPAPSSAPDTSSSVPVPNASPTAAAQPAPQIHGALGDFGGGERSRLAAKGLSLSAHIVSEGAANFSGGYPIGENSYARGTALSSEFGFGVDQDFSKLSDDKNAGILHFLLTTRFGSNLSSEAIGNLASVQEIYGDGQTTRITYFDYEQPLGAHVNLRLGKYNQQNDFIAGSTYWGGNLYCFYQNNTICGTPAAIPIDNGVVPGGSAGYVYYPSSQWGGRLRFNPTKDLYVEAAAIQDNPIVNNSNGGLYLGFNGGVGTELPLEIGLTLRNPDGTLAGNVRVGGYFDTANVQSYATRAGGALALRPYETSPIGLASNAAGIAALPTAYVRGRSGADLQFDHVLAGSGEAGQRGTALFGAFEYADPNSSLIGTMFELGVVRHGTFASRPNDAIALGFATQNYNGRLQQLETQLQGLGYVIPTTKQDQVVEANYGIVLAPWLTIRPDLQYVIRPSGIFAEPAAGVLNPPKNAIVLGLGGYLTF